MKRHEKLMKLADTGEELMNSSKEYSERCSEAASSTASSTAASPRHGSTPSSPFSAAPSSPLAKVLSRNWPIYMLIVNKGGLYWLVSKRFTPATTRLSHIQHQAVTLGEFLKSSCHDQRANHRCSHHITKHLKGIANY